MEARENTDNLFNFGMPSVGYLYKLEADLMEPPISCAEYLLWTYSRTPLIRINWKGEPFENAENPDNWIFL
jgi:hypothetical protein